LPKRKFYQSKEDEFYQSKEEEYYQSKEKCFYQFKEEDSDLDSDSNIFIINVNIYMCF